MFKLSGEGETLMYLNPRDWLAKLLSDGYLPFYVFGLIFLILFMVFGRSLLFGA